jgi:hypothetical protein
MAASLKGKRTPITTPPYQVPSVDITPDPPIFSLVTTFKGPRNRFQGINSASLCILAGQYDKPIPTQLLAPIDCSKIPALVRVGGAPLHGARPPAFTTITVNSKVAVYAPAEWADTLTLFHLYQYMYSVVKIYSHRFVLVLSTSKFIKYPASKD